MSRGTIFQRRAKCLLGRSSSMKNSRRLSWKVFSPDRPSLTTGYSSESASLQAKTGSHFSMETLTRHRGDPRLGLGERKGVGDPA